MRSSRISVLAATAAALLSSSAFAHHMTPLPSRKGWDTSKPVFTAPPGSISGTWSGLTHSFPGSGFPDTMMLLTNGQVMMHDGCTADWYKLTPDNSGSYQNGTWTKAGSMPSGYTPLYFASQVLPTGNAIANGGEYINCNPVWTNLGAIYDSAADKWTSVPAPSGWAKIGDAQSVVRTDGSYMLADCCTTGEAIGTISGSTVTWATTGTGKGDVNDEEGWTQLPDGTLFTVDANRSLGAPNDVELYSESTGAWTTQTAKTPDSCTDQGSHEIGPAPLLPNGLIYQLCGTAHTFVFSPSKGKWTTAPDIPAVGGSLDIADGPAVVLPDDNVLFQASPGVFQGGPSHFFEARVRKPTDATITQVSEPASAASQNSYEGRLMMLPTGQAIWASDVGDVQIYTPTGTPDNRAVPTVSALPKSVKHGQGGYEVDGTGFNGLTFGGYYGDDVQESTNYPLVRIMNNASGHVCYAKTHDFSSGISNGAPTSSQFDVPSSCETGASTLEVVVNGIASKVKKIKVK